MSTVLVTSLSGLLIVDFFVELFPLERLFDETPTLVLILGLLCWRTFSLY